MLSFFLWNEILQQGDNSATIKEVLPCDMPFGCIDGCICGRNQKR
jgi:hypothetical protein